MDNSNSTFNLKGLGKFKIQSSLIMKKIQIGLVEQKGLCNNVQIDKLIKLTSRTRANIIKALNEQDMRSVSLEKQTYIRSVADSKQIEKDIAFVAELAMEYFCLQVAVSHQTQTKVEQLIIRKLQHLPLIEQMWPKMKNSIIFSTSLIQLQLKKHIYYRKATLGDLLILQKLVRDLVAAFPITKQYSKTILTIINHMRLYILNCKSNYQKKLVQICDALIRDRSASIKLMSLQTKVVLFYNCLKTLLGVRNITQVEDNILQNLYQAFGFKVVNRYQQHLLHLFFIIKSFIFKRGFAMEGREGSFSSDQEEQLILESGAAEKLSIWTTVSLDQTSLGLQQVQRSIIRHRVASLATIIGLKLALPKFCLNFLYLMHDSPFNDEAQTIKLCFELFEARQYERLNASLQAVLSSPSCKNLRERQVLISMCAIFTGLYLQDREGALIYAKLNHHQGKKHILRQQTLLQHVAFAYLNLVSHQPYRCNRQAFQEQALIFLRASAKVNPNNYLIQYCLGKLLLSMGDTDKAYDHAKESLMSGRGQWIPYSLLACIYFSQRKTSKATTLIQQLIKKYKGVKTLHYIKAFLEVNRLLLQVEYDQQVEAARELREDIYEMTRQRILKNKSPDNLLKYLQQYHQLSLGLAVTPFDEKYFHNSPILNVETGMFETFFVGYQQVEGQNTIMQIISLLLEAGQINIAEILIKGLPASPLKVYHQALLHQSKKEKIQAIQKYKKVLSQQPYHTPSLINLSLLEEDLANAMHYIQIAQKFVSDKNLWLAKGLVLSKLGNIAQGNEWLVKKGQKGWLEYQPDLLYYY